MKNDSVDIYSSGNCDYSPEKLLNILRGRDVGPTLRQMHELGVLDVYIPEFGAIRNLTRDEIYHQHTVDEHSLLAVENLDESTLSKLPNAEHLLEILCGVDKPELLRLALLLHDIGVGIEGEGGHAHKSCQSAQAVLERWGILDAADVETVLCLIDNHLQMSRIARQRDLDDCMVIQRFAKLVVDETQLKMLYLFTFADMRAVGQSVWNDWNSTLLWQLYVRTSQLLKGEYDTDALRLAELEDAVINLANQTVDVQCIHKHFRTMPKNRLLSHTPHEIVQHILLIEKLSDTPLVYPIATTHNYPQIAVCARDTLGLFCKITGVLTLHGINILSAQVNTREDGIALDIFNVTEGESGQSINSRTCQQIEATLKMVMLGESDISTFDPGSQDSTIYPNAIRAQMARLCHKSIDSQFAPQITINNDESDMYTILEIQAQDRIGLLYKISRTLYEMQVNIYLAKISTEGSRAVDTFYIQNENKYKIDNPKRLSEIHASLKDALS